MILERNAHNVQSAAVTVIIHLLYYMKQFDIYSSACMHRKLDSLSEHPIVGLRQGSATFSVQGPKNWFQLHGGPVRKREGGGANLKTIVGGPQKKTWRAKLGPRARYWRARKMTWRAKLGPRAMGCRPLAYGNVSYATK